ncbi:MAG: methyltransferase domain-containing protein [Planctomycetes bacterium]|nr:methyltransferase domain-containing protein [Planctomycetota bacterium]
MLKFVREALRDIKNTGSVWPSSVALARAMTRDLASRAGTRRVLEVGPGTGPFTKRLLKDLRGGDHLDVVELNELFCDALEKGLLAPFRRAHPDIQVRLHRGRIEDAKLEGNYDVIVCGLPFNNFPPALVRSIFAALLELLGEGGELVYFEYAGVRVIKGSLVGSKGKRQLKEIRGIRRELFRAHDGREQLVLANIPPAYAVRLRKSKTAAVHARTAAKSR